MKRLNIRSMHILEIGLAAIAILTLFFLLPSALADDEEAWFKYKELTLSGSEENGLNDTVRITYDVDTTDGQTLKCGVGYKVWDSSNSIVYELGRHITVTGEESDEEWTAFSILWLDTPRSDNYTLVITIYDESFTEILHEQVHEVRLEVGEEAWFGSKDWVIKGNMIEFECDIDTRENWTQNGTVLVKIRNMSWAIVDTLEIPFIVTGDEEDPFKFNWTPPESGKYDFEITINNETRYLHFQYHPIDLIVRDETAWFDHKEHMSLGHSLDGSLFTLFFNFYIDTYDNHTQEGLLSIEVQNSTGATVYQNTPGIPFMVTGSEFDRIDWKWSPENIDDYTVIIKLLNKTGETVLHEQSHNYELMNVWWEEPLYRRGDQNGDGMSDTISSEFDIGTSIGRNQEIFFQSEVLDSSSVVVENTIWEFEIMGEIPIHINWNWSAEKNDTYTINLTVFDIYGDVIAKILREEVYLFTAYDPIVLCPDDVRLEEVQMQTVQVVWHDDPYWGSDIRKNSIETEGNIAQVKDKRTKVFGTHKDHDSNPNTIDLYVSNSFSIAIEVRVKFLLHPPGGTSYLMWLTNETHWIPASTFSSEYCDIPGTKWISIPAPIPPNTFFEPDQGGTWFLEAEVVDKDGNPILDANPENQDGYHSFQVVDTHGLKILTMSSFFRETNNTSINVPSDEIGKFIFGTYPVDEEESGLGYGFLYRLRLEDGATSIRNYEDWESLTERQRNRMRGEFSASFAGEAWLAGFDRLVLYTEPGFLEIDGARGAFYHSNKRVSYVSQNALGTTPGKTTAHEIGHSYYLWSTGTEEYTAGVTGNNNGTGRRANGYWVSEHEYRDGKYCFMGGGGTSDDNYWIDKEDYKTLLNTFATFKDPEILGVRFLMHSNDTAEPLSWLRIPEGNIDLFGTEEGTHSIILKDGTGVEIARYNFNVSFVLQLEPIGAVEMDVVPVTFRIPWHEGTKTLEIVNQTSGKVLLTREVSDSSPEVTLLSPAGGEVLKPGINEIRWEATDAEGGPMHHIVLISTDGGVNWISLASQDDLTTVLWDSSQWPAGDAYRIKVVTSDGVNTGFGESTNFSLRIEGDVDDDEDDDGGFFPFPGAIIVFAVIAVSGLAVYFQKRK